MDCCKKYAYTPLILLLNGAAVSASPAQPYIDDKKDALSQPNVKPGLSWQSNEPDTDKQEYCLTPSEPGCSNMWQKEKEQENNERIQRHNNKKLYNHLK